MPIKPENKVLYPKNWEDLAYQRKEEAGWRCQGSPAYPKCRARNGNHHPVTGSIVVLTVAHLDHDPTNNDPSNLRVWCQRCHNTYDQPHRQRNAWLSRAAKNGQQMFESLKDRRFWKDDESSR